MIPSLLASLLLCAPAAGFGSAGIGAAAAPVDSDAVQAEFLVRDRARNIDSATAELARDLGADEWRVRRAAVEVLARTRGGPKAQLRELLLGALRDPHPNVRARAVDAAGQRRVDLGVELWDALAHDPLPATRLALTRTLALVRPADVARRLTQLARDEDREVAESAFLALLALGDEAASASAAEWRRRELDANLSALLDATEALSRGPRADALFLALEAVAEPAEVALLAAAQARVGGPADPRALLAAWFAPLPSDDPIDILRRRAQLLAGAEAFGAEILPHLVRDLQALDRWLAGAEADLASRRPALAARIREGASGAVSCREEWTDAALQAARGRGAALRELFDSSSDDGYEALAEAAYGRLDSLEPSGPHLQIGATPPRRASARFAMTELAGEVYVRTLDPGAASWLVVALADRHEPCRREAAYALSSVPDLRPYQRELHQTWLRLHRVAALDWLSRFSRRYPLVSFRKDLVALWEDGVGEVSILELLAAFEGDEELILQLRTWMRRELRRLELSAAGESGGERASEGLARACVSALIRLGAEESVFLEALERTESISEEVAKLAAGQLGKSARGRELLLPWLAPAKPQRLRLEAALAIAPTGHAAAIQVLVTGFDACDEELQVRCLRALGRSGSEAGWTVPLRVAADRGAGAGARLVAYEVLGEARPAARAALSLSELAAAGRDLEGRRLALRALGHTRAPEALAALAESAADGFEHESLREEWLSAAARCVEDSPPGWWLAAWGERPAERAEAELRARFVGERTAAAEFTYRAELESASALAPFADLLLESTEAWWRADARWLLELCERWWGEDESGASDAARRVARAAAVALQGEGSADDSGLVRVRLELRSIAAARADGDYLAAARGAEELLLDRRLGRVRERDWERALGTVDLAQGRDPRARLEALAHDSHARAALARGELDAARAALARAEAECGASLAARRECAQLARAIEAADQ